MVTEVKYDLPKLKTPPIVNPELAKILLYGQSGIGKSTWASKIKDGIFLATEPGLGQLDAMQQPIKSWEDMLGYCREISRGEHGFKTIIIDTLDQMHRYAEQFIAKKYKVDHVGDLDFGLGYAHVKDEMIRVLLKLGSLPYGLVLIAHCSDEEITTRTGKYTRVVPSGLPKKVRCFVEAYTDVILYAECIQSTDGSTNEITDKRVVHTQTSPFYIAKDRSNRLPETMDLDYQVFARAFTAKTKE